MAYATVADYQTRYSLGYEEVLQVETLLADAESLVREFAGARFDVDVPGWLVTLVCEMVHRKLTGPAPGIDSESMSVGPVNISTKYHASGLWLSEDEIALVWKPVVA